MECGGVGGSVVEFSPSHAGDLGSNPRQRRTSLQFKSNSFPNLPKLTVHFLQEIVDNKGLAPCAVEWLESWRFHQHGWGSIFGMGNFLENLKFLEVVAAVRMMFPPLYEPFSWFCCVNGSTTYLTRDQKVKCSIDLNFFMIYGGENRQLDVRSRHIFTLQINKCVP